MSSHKKKMLILDNEQPLLETLQINIREFEVIKATTIEEAISIISNGGISFIVADIKLNNKKQGYEVFDRLFYNGRSVPGIVMTSYELSGDEEEYLKKIGVTKLQKIEEGDKRKLSTRIEETAREILNDRHKRLELVTHKVTEYRLGDKEMTALGRTQPIKYFLQEIFDGKYTLGQEEVIRDAMVKACSIMINKKDDNDYGFPRIP